jgi:AP-3 complex subunit mu
LLQWTVGKVELGRPPTLKGTVSLAGSATAADLDAPQIQARFRINQLTISGLKVARLDIHGEPYKPFKVFHRISNFLNTNR